MELDTHEVRHPHCHFPVPLASPGRVSIFKRLPLFIACSTWEGVEHRSAFEEICHKAWAILLRSYVRNDLVCFVRVQNRDAHGASWPEVKVKSGQADIEVVHCHVDSSSPFTTGIEVQTHLCGAEAFQNQHVNTGIWCSGHDSHGRGPGVSDQRDRAELALILEIDHTEARCSLLFVSPLIHEEYAISIQSTLSNIFKWISRGQHQLIQNVPVLSNRNLQRLLSWNPTDPFQCSESVCMHHLIEDVARRLPNAEAICSWDATSTTYRQLDELSTAAGQRLRRYGVRPGTYVPFAFEKSMWVIVAMLGILKAGGAFVPLNVDDPISRLHGIVQDVKASIIVTSKAMKTKFQTLVPDIVIIDAAVMDRKLDCTKAAQETIPLSNGHVSKIATQADHQVKPTDPIFVLFTSGSTGQPKGMVHDHASICAQWRAQGEALDFHKARILQFAAHTFDVFIIDTLTALMFGGCICIPSEDDRRSNVVDVINEMRVDYAILTPSFAGLIEPSQVPTLKTLLIGGEALPQDRIKTWAEHVRFTQIYGPAEVGICLIMDMAPITRPETVGHPLPNASCWLVDPDDSDSLVPPGAVGELIVAGPSLAKGYFNNPAKTQAFFIPAPAWAQEMGLPFKEFYKTGDLLRLNISAFDGSYDFVGRKDSQIKLRGQRIEPGEVEYYIGQMPGIGNSLVTKPEFGPYAGELVAIVEMRENMSESRNGNSAAILVSTQPSFTLQDVRTTLASQVPGYMLPSAYIEVLNLPHVPSMKIDRRSVLDWLNKMQTNKLSEMLSLRRLGKEETTALVLSAIVANILLKKNEKHHEHFLQGHDFGLQKTGIDSIQITSLAMVIRKTFDKSISAAILLDPDMTIGKLAQIINATNASTTNGLSNGLTNGHNSLNGAHPTPRFNTLQEIRSAMQRLKNAITSTSTCLTTPNFAPTNAMPRALLLTGATGYLGRAILLDLLTHHPTTQIHLLIRCTSSSDGLKRLFHTPKWRPTFSSRIRIHPGDLSCPHLGLSEEDLTALQDAGVETVIHAGAVVHYSTAYGSLKTVNVDSTVELLSLFGKTESMKRFVFVGGGETPSIDTVSSLTDATYVEKVNGESNGYTQSKIVAEAVVVGAAKEVLPTDKRLRVVKPGYIIGGPEDGVANRSDFLWRLLAGCIEVGAYAVEDVGKWVFVSDVDFVAQKVTNALFDEDGGSGEVGDGCVPIDRVLQGVRLEDLWRVLREKFGYGVKPMARGEWMKLLVDMVERQGEEHLLWPLLGTIEEEGGVIGVDGVDSEISDERVKLAVQRNIEYLVEVGFLPAAPPARKVVNGTA